MEKVVSVDFDGTIVYDSREPLSTSLLKPNVLVVLNRLKSENYTLILNTCRHGESLVEAVNFLKSINFEFSRVNSNSTWPSRKILADIYIDDRGILGIPEDWEEIYLLINEHYEK